MTNILGEMVEAKSPVVYTTKTGVNLRLQRFNQLLITTAIKDIPYPEPPKVWIDDPDFTNDTMHEHGRWEDSIMDAGYKAAIGIADIRRLEAITKAYIGYGTKVIYPLPEDVPDVDTEEWAENLRDISGISVPDKGVLRYIAWISNVVITGMEEVTELMDVSNQFRGLVKQEDVEAAEDTFRPDEGGDVSDGVPTPIR